MEKPLSDRQSFERFTMIKHILVALDPDSDTPIAIRYASDIAGQYNAEVVALAVVDTGIIESETRGGGIGSMYYAEKLRENLTEDTRARAGEISDAIRSCRLESRRSASRSRLRLTWRA